MNQDFERRLAEALAALDRGEDVDTVLADYPEAADELASFLETAAYARETLDYFEPPSAAGLSAGRRRMLEAAARKRETATSSGWQSALVALGQWFRTPARGLTTAAMLLALFVVAGGAIVVVAADSLPGDPLYPVKRTVERVRLTVATDPAARAALRAQFNQERQAEAQAVAAMGRHAELQFEGTLQHRMDGTWIVDGIELVVEPGAVEGEPTVGSPVVVEVVSPGDGTLHARHMAEHGEHHGPMMPGGPGPTQGLGRGIPSVSPTAGRRWPMTEMIPRQQPTQTRGPAMPMPTDMAPGRQHRGSEPEPTRGPMEPGAGQQPMTTPEPMDGPMGPGMGQATATPVPEQGPVPTPGAPTAVPATDTPAPETTHHGPMMPHPTEEQRPGPPAPTHTPGGGGRHGGPGGRHGP